MSAFLAMMKDGANAQASVDDFTALVDAALRETRMSFQEAADYLQTAPATVEMWAVGRSAPTPGIRRHVVERLRERVVHVVVEASDGAVPGLFDVPVLGGQLN